MLAGVDIGGTFTDGYYIDEKLNITTAKALSTPEDDFLSGIFNCIEELARGANKSPTELMRSVVRFAHGSTIATNAIIQDKVAKAGMITTKGHKDVLISQLGVGKYKGRPPEERLNPLNPKPPCIIPEELIEEVAERVDSVGEVVVGLNENEVEKAIDKLLNKGVEVIAVCFLWSFLNPSHELRVKEMINKIKPDMFVSCSHSVIPKLGEYQRFTAAVVNGMIHPILSAYMKGMKKGFESKYDFVKPIYIMGCDGGIRILGEIEKTPIVTIGSGPVGGLIYASSLCDVLRQPNIITTDMGGTSFDMGVIINGMPAIRETSLVNQYEYFMPALDNISLGTGGGSIAWYDEVGKRLRVGPQSAGAAPGPACYGIGGTEPTVTDANLVLGYLNPEIMIKGKRISRDKAVESMRPLGKVLDKDPVEMAVGIDEVTNNIMALAIRSEMIARGLDYRKYILLCFGGAAGLHVSEIARIVGIKRCILPQSAAVLSAAGLCSADFKIEVRKEVLYLEPFNLKELNADFAELEEEAKARIRASGVEEEDVVIERGLEMKYHLQYVQLRMPTPFLTGEISEEAVTKITKEFDNIYSERYGEVSLLPAALREIATVVVTGVGKVPQVKLAPERLVERIPAEAVTAPRQIYSKETGGFVGAKTYDGTKLLPGNKVEGSAVIDFPDTSLMVSRGDVATLDEYRNIVMEIGG